MKLDELFPSRWLKGADLNGQQPVVSIAKVSMETVQNQDGGEEQKPGVWFNGTDKGLILNRTNGDAIAKLHGDETNKWTGQQIMLVTERVSAFGQMHDAIRIRPAPSGNGNGNGNGGTPAVGMDPQYQPVPQGAAAEDDLPF